MILILGSGVAGLSCALAAAQGAAEPEIVLVTPGELRGSFGAGAGGGNTALAQGGIAAALAPADTPAAHARDTVAAGAGLSDDQAAAVLASAGAAAVREMIAAGFPADRDADGSLSLGLEAAHGAARIVHAGEDRTGAAVHAHLVHRVERLVESGRIRIIERSRALSLLTDSGAIAGAVIGDATGRTFVLRADAVVVATGGYAALYPRTSNHQGALGDGIVLAARAGAIVADLEFVQFHPTVLAGTGTLISEAVRGAGAVLRNAAGERFMLRAHPAAELAPRDVVSRSVHRELGGRSEAAVWLDATPIERAHGAGTLARRFPHITAAIAARGHDWAREPVEVAPAAHYTMGGIATDLRGMTTVPGLFAAGECAATGVHGANRLASNSLLEGLVFGRRAALAAAEYVTRREWQPGVGLTRLVRHLQPLSPPQASAHASEDATAETAIQRTRAAVAHGLGIERDAEGLAQVTRLLVGSDGTHRDLALMMAEAATARTESRGAHQRTDYPETDPQCAQRMGWALPGTTAGGSASVTVAGADACNTRSERAADRTPVSSLSRVA